MPVYVQHSDIGSENLSMVDIVLKMTKDQDAPLTVRTKDNFDLALPMVMQDRRILCR